MDTDNDGVITIDEFMEACRTVCIVAVVIVVDFKPGCKFPLYTGWLCGVVVGRRTCDQTGREFDFRWCTAGKPPRYVTDHL